MRVLISRFWDEPALAIAVIGALVLAASEALIGDGLTAEDLPTIAGIVGLGGIIRQYVTPTRGN